MGSRPDWATARVQGWLRLQGKALKTQDRTKASIKRERKARRERGRQRGREKRKPTNV